MKLNEALAVYPSLSELASAAGVTYNAAHEWKRKRGLTGRIPPLSAARLAKRSGGKLKFDPDDYDGWNGRDG